MWDVSHSDFVAESFAYSPFKRVKGVPSTVVRCKVSVMAQAAADLSEVVPYDTLQPFQDHFHPTVPKHDDMKGHGLDGRRTGNPMSAITVIPLKDQVCVTSCLFAY